MPKNEIEWITAKIAENNKILSLILFQNNWSNVKEDTVILYGYRNPVKVTNVSKTEKNVSSFCLLDPDQLVFETRQLALYLN